MKSSSAKAKGRRLQQWVRDRMLALVPSLGANDVVSRSSGAGGTDLILSPLAFGVFPLAPECKNVERVNVWAAYAQACANQESDAAVPVVFLSRNHANPLVVLDADEFLRILVDLKGQT